MGVVMAEDGRCPYCGKRPKKRVTCGHWECQHKRHDEKVREWWRIHGKVYNGLRGSREMAVAGV